MRVNAGIYIEDRCSYTTKQFERNIYLGCPVNAIMHFHRFDYDEIMIINKTDFIDSFEVLQLKKYSEASNKPKCYGGGVRQFEQAKSIIEIGYERISVRNLFFQNREEYRRILNFVGRQSVTLCLDILLENGKYYIVCDGDRIIDAMEFTMEPVDYPGEVFLNFINRNGMLSGVDFNLATLFMKKNWHINLNYCGGVTTLKELRRLAEIGFTAATLFTSASTINDGRDKLLNNNIFYE